MTLAQFTSMFREHNRYNGSGSDSSPRSEFSLEGLPEGNAADLIGIGKQYGGLKNV